MSKNSKKKDRDYATGKPVDFSKSEEKVRQEYEQILVEDYGYLKEELDIEVKIPRGSGFYDDKADIVVYRSKTKRDPAKDIFGIVETKGEGKTDGLAQLKSYMTATSAEWGVWTNGDNIAYLCKPKGSASVREDYLNNIPVRGQSIEDVGRLRKGDLRAFGRQELKSAFRRILNTLYANTNISRREKLGNEMIKLIFSKIEDETTYLDRPPAFHVTAGEDPDKVKERIEGIFDGVKKRLRTDNVFSPDETITLESKAVAWVVGQLELGSLTKTDTDVVGDAFEVFAEPKMAGEKGEFFTPRSVIKVAVKLADPRPQQTVCDPACGSGGFLIYSMKYIWDIMDNDPKWRGSSTLDQAKREIAGDCFFGIDKETDLVKIAKAYMAISGDGRSKIVHENTLHQANEFTDVAKTHFVKDEESFQQFDFILTNPPYGTKTKIMKSDSQYFELGCKYKKNSGEKATGFAERDPYVLFVERCLDLLKKEGTLVIVLPETVFHAPSLEYLRQFIMRNNSIQAVIDLPHNTFRPHCNAKTCLLVVRKGVKQESEIIMAAPEEMGHDHQGKILIRHESLDENHPQGSVWDDLAIVLDEITHPRDETNHFTFSIPWSSVKQNVLIPKYYHRLLNEPPLPNSCEAVRLGDLVDEEIIKVWDGHGSPSSSEKGQGTIPYIRVSDIVNWELYRNPTSGVTHQVWERFTKKKHKLEPADIIFVRRGSYRIGTVAMASPRDQQVILTRELLTIRVVNPDNKYCLTPFYLLSLLSSKYVYEQCPSLTFIDTTLPNIGDRWKDLVLPVHCDKDERDKASRRVEQAIKLKWKAQADIDVLREQIGDIVT